MLKQIKKVLKSILPDAIIQTYHYVKMPKKKARENLSFEVHIVEHCNLNCKSCNNFSCLADEEYLDINTFSSDLKQIKFIFGDKVDVIQLLGGEPLLHPRLDVFCRVSREIFPMAKIRIVTNGTLIMKQPNSLWDICREKQVSIRVTHYPIMFDYESAIAYVRSKGVDIDFGDDTKEAMRTMSIFPIDPSGRQNAKKSFLLCGRANTCISLKRGKLYTCTMIPNIHVFNKTFETQIPVTDEDYIDIYKELEAEEILEKLSKPFPICKYCDPGHIVNGIRWEVTKREMSEWVL